MTGRQRCQRARHLADLGRYVEAERELGHALAEAPADVEALVLLSYVVRMRNRYRDALELAIRAVSVAPTDPDAHVQHAAALLALGRTKQGIAAATEVVRLAPQRPSAYTLLARALSQKGQHDQAREAASRAVRLAPDVAYPYLTLAEVEWQAGRWEQVAQAARRALELEPTDQEGRLLLAMLDARDLRVRRSVRALREVARENPLETPDYLLWPLEAGVSRVRWWLPPVGLILTVMAAVGFPDATVLRLFGLCVLLAAAAVVARPCLPAGRAPWRALKVASRWRRVTVLSGLWCVAAAIGALVPFVAVTPWWLLAGLATLAATSTWLTRVLFYGGRLSEEPEIRAAFGAELRDWTADLRQWARETRQIFKEDAGDDAGTGRHP